MDAKEAIAIQQQLRAHVRIENDFHNLNLIAGLDVGYDPETDQSFAVGVLMKVDALTPLIVIRAQQPTPFPYISGLLSFREIPVLIEVLDKMGVKPDVLMVDGQGIAHPRRLGIAAHLGVLMNMPAIGVAKSKLVGTHKEPADACGATCELMHNGEHIGTVLRSKEGCLPLYVSPGHRIGHEAAVDIVLRCLKGYRLPEPIRVADKLSKRAEREKTAFIP